MEKARPASPKQGKAAEVPPEALLAIEKFVQKVGGIDKAKLAIKTLKELQRAA